MSMTKIFYLSTPNGHNKDPQDHNGPEYVQHEQQKQKHVEYVIGCIKSNQRRSVYQAGKYNSKNKSS